MIDKNGGFKPMNSFNLPVFDDKKIQLKCLECGSSVLVDNYPDERDIPWLIKKWNLQVKCYHLIWEISGDKK